MRNRNTMREGEAQRAIADRRTHGARRGKVAELERAALDVRRTTPT